MAIIIVLIVLNSIGCMVARIKPDLTGVIAICMTIVTVVGIILAIDRWASRCKNRKCKKPYTYVEVSRTLRDVRDSTERVQKTYYNHLTGQNELHTEIVDAVKMSYDVVYECRYCGHRKYKVETKKETRR